jgi:predicted helicase
MRQSLLNSFSDLYILDLHGSTKKGELAEDGSKDDNVFDITAGVAIALFVKAPQSGTNQKCEVWHADLYGPRKSKYDWLSHSDIKSSAWRQIIPKGPYYLFKPIEIAAEQEYLLGMKLTDIFPVSSVGISTSRDKIAIQFTPEEMQHIVTEISRLPAEGGRVVSRVCQGPKCPSLCLMETI